MSDTEALKALHPKHWIHKALAKTKKGALHKNLGVAADKKIPADKMAAAENSANPLIQKEAQMAENMQG